MGDEPLFKHAVAHFTLKQWLKTADVGVVALFLEQLEVMEAEIFTRRGAHVLSMLAKLDSVAVKSFCTEKLSGSIDVIIISLMKE